MGNFLLRVLAMYLNLNLFINMSCYDTTTRTPLGVCVTGITDQYDVGGSTETDNTALYTIIL